MLNGGNMKDSKDFKLLTVYEYFDYSVFIRDKNKVEEKFCIDVAPHYGAITENTSDVDKMVNTIKSVVGKNTLADVVMVIVYQMVVSNEVYNGLQKTLSGMSEEELILQIYRQSLYKKDAISVLSVMPLVFRDRLSIDKLIS